MGYPAITVDILQSHPDIFPWEKYPEESARAFASFKTYRDQPAHLRRLKNVCETIYGVDNPTKLRQIHEWSRKFNWVFRCEQWDKHVDEEERREHIKNVKDMRSRHLRVAQALFTQGVSRLRLMSEEDIAKLTLAEMFSFLEKGYAMERETIGVESIEEEISSLSLFQKSNITSPESDMDYSVHTTEELRQILIHRKHIQMPGTTPLLSENSNDSK